MKIIDIEEFPSKGIENKGQAYTLPVSLKRSNLGIRGTE